ncbi:MAG: hypothetical protein JKY27_05905 [Magnetovibrio sp.]|nr:hypothetical protein [Magnetovibrio sp.]
MSTALAAVLFVLPNVALSQDGPVDLSPPLRLDPPAQPSVQPARSLPGGARPAMPLIEPAAVGERDVRTNSIMGGVVQTEAVGVLNPDLAGALSEAQGGFGNAMWRETQLGVIENLLPQIPVTTASPAMRDLMRRLLLTGAVVPQGTKRGSLISLRAGLLSAMGDFVGVNSLLSAVPGRTKYQDLLRVEVDTRFLTGDVARACQLANAYIQEQQSTYWQKAFIFCQALEGDTDSAMLGMSLLEEQGVDDPVFFQLVEAVVELEAGAKPPVIDSLSDPTPLHLALARVAKVNLPNDVISSNRPGVLRAIAISPNAPPELRLEAAERAEFAGALQVDTLRQLYASITFSDDQLKNPLSQSTMLSGPMSRALLYRATLMQTVPAAQAEALMRALEMARRGGRYASTARAFLPQLGRVSVSPDLAWFAPEAIRAFLISGRAQGAAPWFNLLKGSALLDAKMARELDSLMPVARLSGFEGASEWTMDQLSDWWASVKDTDGARDKAVALAATFEALGEYVPDKIGLIWWRAPRTPR